ncbi:uncharacterized protein LACBIDRAFT_295208 [Laccaria bicolor S238N-H82]|uniref:Predicted protein n=1 Tax=Laccaria bicolor (strain S238N-H82 / ATCC MYA-4686) TaxID=486041 RepID=B0DPC5_LACBS|nr:uncharacterized protein LACBIDRAFT_295208 [Laccaria bicolor S238N-H82]EDR03656.1 predicted protein [Laccaria bicolor S238N-H82]|eukprot:XP_001885804.1 predicted protein [Laccaria bicolor S238N-H82]
MCKQNRAALAIIKEQSDNTVEGATLRDTESALKKWVQSYRPIISSSVIHALTLQTNPDLCFTHVLVIVLVPNTSFPNWVKSIPNSFLVDDVYPSSMDELTSMKPEWGPGFTSLVERSKALRAKGGLGYALSLILVKGSPLAHMTPFGIDEMFDAGELPWNYRWEETLKDLVAQGKVV